MSGERTLDVDFEALNKHAGIKPFIWDELRQGRANEEIDLANLPVPTRNVARLKRDLAGYGYCLIADAVASDVRKAMLERVVEQYEGEREAGVALPSPTRDARLTNLLMKGEVFRNCVLHPIADAVLEHALGEGFLLSSLGSVRTLPGSLAQGLHIDQTYVGFPTPVPLVCNTVWMLEDWTEETGATRFVPGSHRWSPEKLGSLHEGIGLANGDGKDNPPGSVALEAPAGTCLVFDGRALHGTGANKSADKTRTGVFAYYCRPFLRQFENPFLSIDDRTMMSLPGELRAQLGYRPWFLTGGFECPGRPAPMNVVRPVDRIGAMKPGRRGGR